jgi:hypothetical protein
MPKLAVRRTTIVLLAAAALALPVVGAVASGSNDGAGNSTLACDARGGGAEHPPIRP